MYNIFFWEKKNPDYEHVTENVESDAVGKTPSFECILVHRE